MNVCLIGNNLTSLTLAQSLVKKKIEVKLYSTSSKKFSKDFRTIGISSENLNFIDEEIIKIKKDKVWDINEIEIYDKTNSNKVLDFQSSNKKLFSIIKHDTFYTLLEQSLKKNKLFQKKKITKKLDYKNIMENKKFNLIINCEKNNIFNKKFFSKRILKDYRSNAHTAILNHSKTKNRKAIQIFTKLGPIAFLPVSQANTSVVFSIKGKELADDELKKLINENNNFYKINNIRNIRRFKLKSQTARNYFYKNILLFGDGLHQIHPLAGQGFNMILRDIKNLLGLIDDRLTLGLPIDENILSEFTKNTKHLNILFSSGIDFIHQFFMNDNDLLKQSSKSIFNYLNKNKTFNNFTINIANKGLNI